MYNWALGKVKLGQKQNYHQQSAELTQHKREKTWLSDVSSVPLQQSLRHLQTAFNNFFEGRAKFPSFKSKKHRQSATFTTMAFRINDGKVYLAKQKQPLRIKWSRELPSEPKSLTLIKEPDGRYYVSFTVELEPTPMPLTNKAVGVDLGLTDLIVTSDGFKSGHPRFLRRLEKRLAKAQRSLSRKVKGSGNWHKQRIRVARIHADIRHRRADYLHKLTTNLVKRYDTICVETLAVRHMVSNRSLGKAISDTGWYQFVSMLEYKCPWYGKKLVKIDRWYPSSKTCSGCGHRQSAMPLRVREWVCPACGSVHNRDVNAAKNILAVGHTV